MELTQNFSNIMANPVIATKVEVVLLLHRALAFRREDETNILSKEGCERTRRVIGNITV